MSTATAGTAAPKISVRSAAASDVGKDLSSLRAYYHRILAESRGGKTACQERAQTVYLGIRKSSKVPYGLDKLVAARRQRKAILRMAAGYEMAETAAKAAIGMLNHDFATGQAAQLRETGFDMTK